MAVHQVIYLTMFKQVLTIFITAAILKLGQGEKAMQLLESGLKVKDYEPLRRNFSETGWSCHASWLITRGAPLKSEEAFLSCSSVAMMITVPTESLFFLGLLNL